MKGTSDTVQKNGPDRLGPPGGFVKGDISRHLGEFVIRNRADVLPLLAWARPVVDLGMKLMQLILSALRNTDRPIPVYVRHAWFTMDIPSILIAAMVIALFGTRLPATESLLPPLMISTWFGVTIGKGVKSDFGT